MLKMDNSVSSHQFYSISFHEFLSRMMNTTPNGPLLKGISLFLAILSTGVLGDSDNI